MKALTMDTTNTTPAQIVLASDHAGYTLKEHIKQCLQHAGYYVIDLGPHNSDRVDYPDYAVKVATHIKQTPQDMGILVCGSGIGMSMMANRFDHIRCALVSEPESAALSRRHNDSNVLALGARLVGPDMAWACVTTWLNTDFEYGRHEARVNKLHIKESAS